LSAGQQTPYSPTPPTGYGMPSGADPLSGSRSLSNFLNNPAQSSGESQYSPRVTTGTVSQGNLLQLSKVPTETAAPTPAIRNLTPYRTTEYDRQNSRRALEIIRRLTS
jgi:hypothetical protein